VADMVEHAPNLCLLVTSRERLNLQAEWVLPVTGLPVSVKPASNMNGVMNVKQVDYYTEQNDAIQLFVQSARRVYPNFILTAANGASIAQICHTVAGMPLAIELAASWVRVLSCPEIALEIERSIGFLTTTLRDIPARHRSITAVFESAWRLLTDAEQHVLRRLALFRGGCRRAAAEQVAGATLPILATLVDKSFLQHTPTGRYTLHELVRQFATEKLASADENTEVQGQYVAFYLTLAETAEPHLVEAEQATWLMRLAEEHDNLRAALRIALNSDAVETAARISSALLRFWDRHNHHPEGCGWFVAIFAHPQASHLPVAVQLKALFAAGSLARRQDDLPQAARWLEACLTLSRQQGDRGWQAIVLNSLGLLARRQGAINQAVALYEESLALGRILDDQRTIVNALGNLGSIAMLQDEYERAYAFHAEGLAFSRAQGDLHGIAADLNNLGQVAFRRKDYAQAKALQEECLTLYRQLGDQRGILLALEDLGVVAYQIGDVAGARAYFQEGLALAQAVGDKVSAVQFLERLAGVAVAQGKPACAAHLWGAAAQQREVLNTPLVLNELADHEQQVSMAREQLAEQQFSQAWATGRLQSLAQAICYAQLNL
jgi:predicted ATPase